MFTQRLTCLAVAAATAFTLAACSDEGGTSSSGADLVKADTLTVCSDIPYAPFEIVDDTTDSGYSGFDMDIVAEIADRLDLELAVKDSGFDGLQSGLALNSGECDLVASALTITEDRAKNLAFSDPYYDSKQSLLVPTDSDIADIGDLDGTQVGVQKDTTGKTYAEENATGAEIVSLPDDPAMFQALKAGQVDALLQDLPVNLTHTTDGEFTIVETYETDEQYGLAAKLDNDQLVEDINGALADMRDDGTYDELYAKYFEVE